MYSTIAFPGVFIQCFAIQDDVNAPLLNDDIVGDK